MGQTNFTTSTRIRVVSKIQMVKCGILMLLALALVLGVSISNNRTVNGTEKTKDSKPGSHDHDCNSQCLHHST